MGKRTTTLKTTFAGTSVTFGTEDGKFSLVCDVATLDTPMRERATLAGVAHTIRDAGALPMGSSMAEKVAAMRERWDCIIGGEWERERVKLSPEQRAAKLRDDVCTAWISLSAGRSETEFHQMVERNRAKNSAALQMAFTGEDVIRGLARTERIAGAMAAARKPAIAMEFDDIE